MVVRLSTITGEQILRSASSVSFHSSLLIGVTNSQSPLGQTAFRFLFRLFATHINVASSTYFFTSFIHPSTLNTQVFQPQSVLMVSLARPIPRPAKPLLALV